MKNSDEKQADALEFTFHCFFGLHIEQKKKFHYFMLSGRISRNIGDNIFRSYTGVNTDFHVLVA